MALKVHEMVLSVVLWQMRMPLGYPIQTKLLHQLCQLVSEVPYCILELFTWPYVRRCDSKPGKIDCVLGKLKFFVIKVDPIPSK